MFIVTLEPPVSQSQYHFKENNFNYERQMQGLALLE